MSDTNHGGKRPNAGRKTGSKSEKTELFGESKMMSFRMSWESQLILAALADSEGSKSDGLSKSLFAQLAGWECNGKRFKKTDFVKALIEHKISEQPITAIVKK